MVTGMACFGGNIEKFFALLTGKHILIIDDDPDDRDFITQALKQITATVDCIFAANGYEALMLLQHEQSFIPDYIFLDLNMPLMDGNECLQRLKQAERLKNIPVIICSTTKNVNEQKAVMQFGATDFIIKPIRLSDWVKLLRNVFISEKI